MDLEKLKIDRQPRKARRRRNPWPVRAVALIVLVGLGWVFWGPVSAFVDRINLPEVRTLLVTEATPASVAAVRGTAANGYVVAARRAALSSDVPGRIVEMNVREGSVVAQGDIVARLFADEFAAALERAAADLAVAEADIERARTGVAEREARLSQSRSALATARARLATAAAEARFAEQEHERAVELLATESGSEREVQRTAADRDASAARQRTATEEVEDAKLAVTVAERQLDVGRNDVTLAERRRDAAAATRKQAQATLDKTDVRAPFDGVVVLKDAEIGEVVSPNSQGGSNARGAVCTMVDFASLEIQAEVPETSLSSVELGAAADVFVDARPDEKLAGVVDRIWPTADRSKATVEVRIVVDEEQRRQLRPEYGVRVVFRPASAGPVEASVNGESSPEKRIVIPEAAVVEIDGRTTAFVLERDTVRATAVTVGERKNGRVTIDAGLRSGQRIIAEPPLSLRDGDRVRIQQN